MLLPRLQRFLATLRCKISGVSVLHAFAKTAKISGDAALS
jgi:hypothetical protein